MPDINIDTTGDGKPNVNIDTDGDGIPDLNIDTTGDGVADSNIDTDGDGIADKNIIGTVDTGSNDMFSIALFSSLAVLASVLLIIIRRKSKRVSE
ncbi:MAG: hypothetical protein K2G22_03330 [Eubacterium sp.]|nr:hypothetical protein [Eubacterium sp.]